MRSRSGKFNVPMNPEKMIKYLLKSYLNMRMLKFDIKIVPVCINFDRIFESSFLASEIITGQFKPGTTLFGVLYQILQSKKEKLGKVFVKYAEPIDMREYLQSQGINELDEQSINIEAVSMQLTKDLYQIHQREQPITMNSLIASSLLFHSKPMITFQHVKTTTKNLFTHIQRKGYKTYISGFPQNFDINKAAISLGFKIVGNPLDKRKGN
jgi:glycerol-3-phosphate O-acyltransferase